MRCVNCDLVGSGARSIIPGPFAVHARDVFWSLNILIHMTRYLTPLWWFGKKRVKMNTKLYQALLFTDENYEMILDELDCNLCNPLLSKSRKIMSKPLFNYWHLAELKNTSYNKLLHLIIIVCGLNCVIRTHHHFPTSLN